MFLDLYQMQLLSTRYFVLNFLVLEINSQTIQCSSVSYYY